MKHRCLLICILLATSGFTSGTPLSPALPDPVITPGDVLTTDPNVICEPGYSKSVRNVSSVTKSNAYASYGITSHAPGEYEVDHLISLELGGSNSIRNLWPESYLTQPLNAHVKDKLENHLHHLVCTGALSLTQAQKDIAENWVAAYEKYIGKLDERSSSDNDEKNPVRAEVSNVNPVENRKAMNCPEETPIKVSKRGIIHRPGDPNYSRTNAISCFSSEDEAIRNGFRLPR